MDILVSTLIAPGVAEALKTWGAYAICLLLLGVGLWLSDRRSRYKDARIEKLEVENARLQDLRVQDAQRMIMVAQSGIETIRARTETEAVTREMVAQLVGRQSSDITAPKPPALAPILRSP